MKTRVIATVLTLLILGAGMAHAQLNVTVDPAAINLGFMNVFLLPADGGGFEFGSVWGFADLTAVYDGNILTLGPNTIGDPAEYWYIGGGGPGAPGNKIMEANSYAQLDGGLGGQTVTFSGTVTDYSLTDAHMVRVFIKDFAPDFSSFVESAAVLSAEGAFNISLATIDDDARHVQWGFQMIGVNVWATDVGPFGTISIGPDGAVATESASWGDVKSLYR